MLQDLGKHGELGEGGGSGLFEFPDGGLGGGDILAAESLGGAGLQDHHADCVAHHVVQFPGDP